jgi:SAM-dependent methyltransferase
MNESNLLNRAVNPKQYDNPESGWESESGIDSPRRKFFWDYLNKYTENWKDKDIIDIGAGSGWLVNELHNHKIKSALAIEPSENNVQRGKELYPEIQIEEHSIEVFETENKFDVAILNMVVSHVKDLDLLFGKLNTLLRDNGEVYMTVPDFEYFKGKDDGYNIEHLSESEFISAGKRADSGSIVDIVRKNELYITSATAHGFDLIEEVPMLPTESLMNDKPQYKEFAEVPITHLLRFKKTEQ